MKENKSIEPIFSTEDSRKKNSIFGYFEHSCNYCCYSYAL